MKKQTLLQLEESKVHIKPYMKHEHVTKELREMCSCCECYCGKHHNYEECENKQCFKFWLAFQYLEWGNGCR